MPLENTPEQHASQNNENESIVNSLYEWMEAAIFSLVMVTVIFAFFIRIVAVKGDSMIPTLFDGERLIISRLTIMPDRGDIVIINRYSKEPMVKRVIAVGGDTLEIREETNEVLINGKVLKELYIQGLTYPIQLSPGVHTVPDGYLFVMGDNRQLSDDSRNMMDVGFVKTDDIIGKAVYRFLPFSRAGGLY